MNFYPSIMRSPARIAVMILLTAAICFIPYNDTGAVPADPTAVIEVTQPDGATRISLRMVGDERNGMCVTMDGYTVVTDDENWYHYAILDASGDLVPSGRTVLPIDSRSAADERFLSGTAKYLAATSDRLTPDPGMPEGGIDRTLVNRGPETTNNVLLILIKYTDLANTYPQSDLDDMMNQNGYDGFGCVNEYYQEVSYGQFGINATVTTWYTAANPSNTYGWQSINNPNWQNQAKLAKEAVEAAKLAGVNFAPYDNNGDGFVDGLFIVHAGPGAEVVGSGYPWSHKWSLSGAGLGTVSASGKTINVYTMQPEKYNHTTRTRIGVYCHEYGHALGLPDLYDTDATVYEDQLFGVGTFCLMSGGSWNGPAGGAGKCPAHMTAWCKAKLSWLTPVNIDVDKYNWLVTEVETTPVAYRLWTAGAASKEYFLVEYRRQTGFDTYLASCGMAIWHIDENKTHNKDDNDRMVDLEEKDNTESSANESGDLWLAPNAQFARLTVPNSRSKAGNDTQVEIQVYSASCPPPASGLFADLLVGVAPSPVEIMIRDCEADIGNEPSNECAEHWKCPDIYIENDNDGFIDLPAPGLVNQIWFVARNIGTNQATNVQLKHAQHVLPSMGLYFPNPNGTDIAINKAFNPSTITPGVSERVSVNWLVPADAATTHYCIGAVLEATNDPQTSVYAKNDNNVGWINIGVLYQKAGQVVPPAGRINTFVAGRDDTVTVFERIVGGCNPELTPGNFVARLNSEDVDSLPDGWTAYLENEGPHTLVPDSCVEVLVHVEAINAEHLDSANLGIEWVKADFPDSLIGGFAFDYGIDDHPAEPVADLRGTPLMVYPDDLDAQPWVMLEWTRPATDSVGGLERTRWNYVYSSDSPGIRRQDVADSVAIDADPDRPGFQWYDMVALDSGEVRYYRMAAVDGSYSLSEMSNEISVEYGAPLCAPGDANNSGGFDIDDVVYLIAYIFSGGPAPVPYAVASGDPNCSCGVDIDDVVYMIAYIFSGGPEPCGCEEWVAACGDLQ